MRVNAFFHGILADWVGTREASFELPDGATYGDLLVEIGRKYRANMPEQLWDERTNDFNANILAVGAKGNVDSPENPLRDGEEIKFFLMLAGG